MFNLEFLSGMMVFGLFCAFMMRGIRAILGTLLFLVSVLMIPFLPHYEVREPTLTELRLAQKFASLAPGDIVLDKDGELVGIRIRYEKIKDGEMRVTLAKPFRNFRNDEYETYDPVKLAMYGYSIVRLNDPRWNTIIGEHMKRTISLAALTAAPID